MATNYIAIACQGGGSHAAFTGGVLPVLLGEFDNLALAHSAGWSGRAQAYHEPGTAAGTQAGTQAGTAAPVLVAISGTSGGAISALLGWYGFITGGAEEAGRRLDAFWDSNAATHWLEASLNHYARAMSDAASMFGLDVKTSPYTYPMQGLEWFNTSVWPMVAGALGADNPWMRPDYFSLPQLLRPGVDWQLVRAYGDFASIPLDVQRWVRSDLQAAMFPPDAPCQQRYREERAMLEQAIGDKLGAAQRVLARIEQLGLGDSALLRVAFRQWRAPPLRFEHDALMALADAVGMVTRAIPRLLIGAVELHQGDFMAFNSERAQDDGGISVDAVLASAAVPWLFRARLMKGMDQDTLAARQLALWDGLFSQNPPIKDFLAGVMDVARKPDEIWVVQINPTHAKVEKTRPHAGTPAATADRLVMQGSEIWDLRNALAGNLSLNQEIGFVEAINRRMEASVQLAAARRDGDGNGHGNGDAGEPRPDGGEASHDRLVQVDRIVMDGDAIEAATCMDLGANSKLDRDPRLKAALCEHGRLQARRYLRLRRQVGRLCGQLGDTLAQAGASAAAADGDGDGKADGAARAGNEACRAAIGSGALVIDGSTLYSTGVADPAAPRALVRWRAVDAEVGGHPVRIEGRSELADDLEDAGAWRVKAVTITAAARKDDRMPQGAASSLQAGIGGEPPMQHTAQQTTQHSGGQAMRSQNTMGQQEHAPRGGGRPQ